MLNLVRVHLQHIASLANGFDNLMERIDAVVERIDVQQSEIRGLQTENRRILEILERGEGKQQ
jgi:hypothetical protein